MNQEQNNINLKSQGSNGVPNDSSLNSNKIMGYDSQTGTLLYGTNNINNQVQNVRYATFWERLGAMFRDVLQIWWFAVLGFCLMTILRVGLDASGMGESSFLLL